MTLEERARRVALHTDADCGDCPCPEDLGGDGYCEALYYKVLRELQEAVTEAKLGGSNA